MIKYLTINVHDEITIITIVAIIATI